MSDTDDTDDVRRVHRAAAHRQHERASAVEAVLEASAEGLKFPSRTEEVAATYTTGETDLSNETESLAEARARVGEVREEPVATFETDPSASSE